MRPSLALLASAGLFSPYASAWILSAEPGSSVDCLGGCLTALNSFSYVGPGSDLLDENFYYEKICDNDLFLKSLFYCGITYCTKSEVSDAVKYLDGVCQKDGGFARAKTASEVGVPDGFTKQDVKNLNLPVVTILNATVPSLLPITTPLFADLQYVTSATTTWATFNRNINNAWKYGYALIIFWGIVAGMGVTSQIVKYARNYLASNAATDIERNANGGKMSFYSKARLWVSGNLITAPAFGYNHLTPIGQRSIIFTSTLPRRLESLTIAAFIIINIVLIFPSYELTNDNLYYPMKKLQLARYLADRTGMLCQANLLITWLFGTRNNFLQWITGWSFSTFNAFHRWAGRLFVLQVIIHSAGYTVFAFDSDTWHSSWKEEYWYTGEASTMAFCLMLGFSVYWIRYKMYDIFLTIHIALALVGIVTLWYHLNIFEGTYDGWYWPAIAFWGFDRLCRMLRVGYVFLRSSSSRAKVTYDETADILTIDATKVLDKVKPAPGTYYFVYLPTKWWGWQAHPFTLVSWKSNAFSDDSSNSSTPPESVHLSAEKKEADVEVRPRQNSAIAIQNATQNYSFSIRPHKGFTSTVRKFCLANPQAAANVPILLEGPYGTPHPIPRGVSDVLLIMGGTGINVAVNYIFEILQRTDQKINIRLVWALRFQPFLKNHLENEMRDVVESGRVKIEAHVTAKKPTFISDESKTETSTKTTADDLIAAFNISERAKANITIDFERPYVPDVVAESAEAASGRMAIVVCGPARMADDARQATVHEMRRGKDIEFLEEQFGW